MALPISEPLSGRSERRRSSSVSALVERAVVPEIVLVPQAARAPVAMTISAIDNARTIRARLTRRSMTHSKAPQLTTLSQPPST
jgi:hypothetical protein